MVSKIVMFSNLYLLILLIPVILSAEGNPELQSLANEFWQWRVVTQPATGDDILRVERPDGWQPDYSKAALEEYRARYMQFRQQLETIPKSNWTRSDSVDYLCLRSAIERVNWELNILRLPHRNPDFYVHQTIGTIFELLLIHTPMDTQRAQNIITRIQSFPKTINNAKENLTEPSAPFAKIAIKHLNGIGDKLRKVSLNLEKLIDDNLHSDLNDAMEKGITALENYRNRLEEQLPGMTQDFAPGRENYIYFLKNIALLPYSPEEILQQGHLEWNRSVAFETFEKLRNKNEPKQKIFNSVEEQIEQANKDEQDIREFLEKNDIMTVPGWMQHYINKKMPDHVEPLSHMGVDDDLTSETRLDEDAVRYTVNPDSNLSYFSFASAHDPRPIIIHEGIPGHYFQLARSWKNPNPIRRRFVDSGPIEGIGLHVEELLLQFGLFDNQPHTREIIYSFMRLRALRVEIDVQLALGNYDIQQAAGYLAKTVPMDEKTALSEAGFFAYNPGQAISYQVGKLQIMKFLADTKLQMKEKFSLRDFHDYLMINGNVPISLLRWEYLGLRDEIEQFFE